jgi:hypothetical protein
MAYSYNDYIGTGSPQTVPVPPYIDRSHIKVSFNGVDQVFTWMGAGTVQFTAPNGAAVRVRRESSPFARVTDYTDGVPLTEAALDNDSLQAFYLSQEQIDKTDEAVAAVGSVAANAAAAAASASAASSAASTAAASTSASILAAIAPYTGAQSVSGALTVTTSGSSGSIVVNDVGAGGANIRLRGNGGVTPDKYIRAAGGVFQILNNAYQPLLSITDGGIATFAQPTLALADSGAFCHYLRGRSSDDISAIQFQGFTGTEMGRMFVGAGGALTYSTGAAGATQQMNMNSSGNWAFGGPSATQKFEITRNQNGSTVLVIRNTDAGAAAAAILQLTNNTKFVNLGVNFASSYYAAQGAGGIVTCYHDFDTHIWRTNAGTQTMTLSSTGLLTLTGAGATPAVNDNSTKVATTAYVRNEINRLGFTRVFESSNQTVTPNSVLNVAHGLGAIPKLFRVYLKCTTTEAATGYSAGDEIAMDFSFVSGVSVVQCGADGTNVSVRFTGGSLQVLHKTTAASTTITTTNWAFVVRAYA